MEKSAYLEYLLIPITTYESEEPAKKCREWLDSNTGMFKERSVKLYNSHTGMALGKMSYKKESGRYIISIHEGNDEKFVHREYILDEETGIVHFNLYKTIHEKKPQKTGILRIESTKYVGGEESSFEVMEEGNFCAFSEDDQKNVKSLMYHCTPFLQEVLKHPMSYCYHGPTTFGKIEELVFQTEIGIAYQLHIVPNGQPEKTKIKLDVDNGKATLSCYLAPSPENVSFEEFIKKVPFDYSTLTQKISILRELNVDTDGLPSLLQTPKTPLGK